MRAAGKALPRRVCLFRWRKNEHGHVVGQRNLLARYADIPACHDDMEAFAAQFDGRVHVVYDGLKLRF